MSRKKQELQRLRREVEILRAQLKGTEAAKATKVAATEPKTFVASDPPVASATLSDVEPDLKRSLLITGLIVAALVGLALSQTYWN